LGIGKNLKEALYKGLVAAGYKMRKAGGVFVAVRDSDKGEISAIARKFHKLGFTFYATAGTAKILQNAGLQVTAVNKISESSLNNTISLLESGKLAYIISTSEKGRDPAKRACALGIPCLTSLDTADAIADSLLSGYSEINTELVDINDMRESRMQLPFTKMQTLGNDYIYIDCISEARHINSPESLSAVLSHRHFGIGGDGVVLIEKSTVADAAMRQFNLDGSEGLMCGNAMRCVAKYLYDNRIVYRDEMTIETKSGIKSACVFTKAGLASSVRVIDAASFDPGALPTKIKPNTPDKRVINAPLDVDGTLYHVTCVSVGNPHAVLFFDEIDTLDIAAVGSAIEHHPMFPNRVNVEFIKVIDPNTLKMRVWERGSGETMACGSGSCAAVAAAVLNGHCKAGEDVKVVLPGGELVINYTEERVTMTGDCVKVFEGIIEI
jgi:carbamoyl-phosphate synthase large subunit